MKKIGKESKGSELFTVIEPGLSFNQLSEIEKGLIIGGECNNNVSGPGACATQSCNTNGSGTGACGADGCHLNAGGTTACGAEVCGVAACGPDACAAAACGVVLCSLNLCPIQTCPIDACAPVDLCIWDVAYNGSESGSDSYPGGYSDDFGISMA